MSDDFDLRLLAGTSLTSPDRYPNWKISRNSAVALGAVTAAGMLLFWAASENDKRRVAPDENGRGL